MDLLQRGFACLLTQQIAGRGKESRSFTIAKGLSLISLHLRHAHRASCVLESSREPLEQELTSADGTGKCPVHCRHLGFLGS